MYFFNCIFLIVYFFKFVYYNIKKQMIPKVIYLYWDDKVLPPFIQKCYENIKEINDTWTVKLYNMSDIEKIKNKPKFMMQKSNIPIIQEDNKRRISDWFRLYILNKHGGVYIDISSVFLRNLDNLVDINSNKMQGYNVAWKKMVLMENFFIASPKKNKFLELWLKETEKAYINKSDYCELNYKYVGELNNYLPYLTQHLAWIKVRTNMKNAHLYYKMIDDGTLEQSLYFWIDLNNKHESINKLLKLKKTDPIFDNKTIIKFNSYHRNIFIDIIKNNLVPSNSYIGHLLHLI